MVCTLLAGFNVVAFAADDDVETIDIYGSYYQGTGFAEGDHLYGDKARIDDSLNYNYRSEGIQWYAPVVSSTLVASAWNSATGEHLFYLSNEANEKFIEEFPVWVKDDAIIFSDDNMGVPIYRMFNPAATKADTHIYKTAAQQADIEILKSLGYVFETDGGQTTEQVPYFYGVNKEDKKNAVTITDLNGFQADGTALEGDTLQLVFGSDFGTPKTVAWYKDGAVVKVSSTTIQATELKLITGTPQAVATGNAEGSSGVYYAVVENTDGKSYTTDKVTVAPEGTVVLSDYSLADNYGALLDAGMTYADRIKNSAPSAPLAINALSNRVVISDQTDQAVVTVTTNKDYEGSKLYLFDTEGGQVKSIVGSIELDDVVDDTVTDVVRASKFSDAALYNACYNSSAGTEGSIKVNAVSGNPITGIYYVDAEGAVHYKFLASTFGGAIKRGTEYTLACVDGTNTIKVGDNVESLNATESFKMPYVMAPDTIEVTKGQSATNVAGWSAKLSMMGMDAQWITDATITNFTTNPPTVAAPNVQIKLYDNTSVKNTGGKEFTENDGVATAVRVVGGEAADLYAAGSWKGTQANGQAVYAKFTAPKGIFGADKLELTSSAVETAIPAATSVDVEESDLDPYAATVTFDGLRTKASGTVYILQGNQNTTSGALINVDESSAIASAYVEGGETEIDVEDVFDSSDINGASGHITNSEYFIAKFVPDDEDTYGEVYSDVFTLTDVITDYELDTTSDITVSTTSAVTAGTVTALNQFGEEVAPAQFAGSIWADKEATNAWLQTGGEVMLGTTSVAASTGKLEVAYDDNADAITIKVDSYAANAFKKGNYAAIELRNGDKLLITCTQTADGTNVKFSVTVI